jgi:hypothetical protein
LRSLLHVGLLADPSRFVVVGYNESTATCRRSVGVAVASSAGQQLWSRTYRTRCVVKDLHAPRTSDGGLLVWRQEEPAGRGHSYPYLLRLSAKGGSIWPRAYGRNHRPPSATGQTSDGGLVLTGTVYDPNGRPAYLLKTNAQGDTLWFNSYHHLSPPPFSRPPMAGT